MGREGYSENLSEFDIPLAARIVSLANVYDSLTSPRVYKEGLVAQQYD